MRSRKNPVAPVAGRGQGISFLAAIQRARFGIGTPFERIHARRPARAKNPRAAGPGWFFCWHQSFGIRTVTTVLCHRHLIQNAGLFLIMHLSSMEKMERFSTDYLKDRIHERLTIYDIGSQDLNGSYRRFFTADNWRYFGIDMSTGKNVDIVLSSAYHWKELTSDSADVVISGQTLEHIEFPWLTMLEISRVLKPGGLCCIIAPAGGYEHKYPVDCWRIFPDGFRALAKISDIEVIETNAQWTADHYEDDSEVWQDCILIGRKKKSGFFKKIKISLCRFLALKSTTSLASGPGTF